MGSGLSTMKGSGTKGNAIAPARGATYGADYDVSEAIDILEAAVGRLSPSEPSSRNLQSVCALLRSMVQNERKGASMPDRLAPMVSVPEALIHCRPPTLAQAMPGGSELDVGVDVPPPLDAKLSMQIEEWSFNLHEVPDAELPALAYGAMIKHPEFSEMDLNKKRLWRFIKEISSRYRANPFHSFRHAVDVTLASSFLVRMVQRHNPEILKDPQYVVALLVAALVHDTDHLGVMNGFLQATRHPLAVMYNNQSILENHHCATALSLLERPELNFLAALPVENQVTIKRFITLCVLSTDVTTHMKFMKQFSALLADSSGASITYDVVMQVVIKAADISNPTRNLEVYKPWIEGVMKEFFAQGDAERELGLPISMNCDRNVVDVSNCQVGFIKFLVKPLFSGLAEFIPELNDSIMPTLEANLAHFAAGGT
mmetsp:Transcript_22439/g.38348  ORF Transcript_22439/g.38348 Transcript_22439/m.38348 type:complete len:428 (+) Transcript_22439:75-1358(+)